MYYAYATRGGGSDCVRVALAPPGQPLEAATCSRLEKYGSNSLKLKCALAGAHSPTSLYWCDEVAHSPNSSTGSMRSTFT